MISKKQTRDVTQVMHDDTSKDYFEKIVISKEVRIFGILLHKMESTEKLHPVFKDGTKKEKTVGFKAIKDEA